MSGGSLSGTTVPSMRRSGGVPLVMCMSLAPFSTIARRSCWSVYRRPSCCPTISVVMRSIPHRHAADLLGRGDAREHLLDPAHPEGQHPALDGRGLELGRGRALEDHLLQR